MLDGSHPPLAMSPKEYTISLFMALANPGVSIVHQNSQVTDAWNKIAKSFKCSPIEGESTVDPPSTSASILTLP